MGLEQNWRTVETNISGIIWGDADRRKSWRKRRNSMLKINRNQRFFGAKSNDVSAISEVLDRKHEVDQKWSWHRGSRKKRLVHGLEPANHQCSLALREVEPLHLITASGVRGAKKQQVGRTASFFG
jgi:hypothetical protein